MGGDEQMIEKEFTIKPLISGYSQHSGKPYREQVILYDDEYPFAMVHIDLFWPGSRDKNPEEKYDIHDALSDGEEIKVKVIFEIVEDEDDSR
jgi:hypothetical protein